MLHQISISPKYQVTIPSEIRKNFPDIIPFNKVIIEAKGDIIQIRPQKRLEDVVGILGKPPISNSNKSMGKMREDAYKKYRKI